MSLGIVVIGRNEGELLRVCLESAIAQTKRLVYVDSGSTDDSIALARSLNIDVIELDPSRPFTAARGRMQDLSISARPIHPSTGCSSSMAIVS